MVVLSAAIVASGRTLLARQFVEMTRLRVEGLLSAFPKLVDSGRDHTYIETETVRYVYQPMESLFLLLITNRSSNILEDLETLRLLAKVVQDCCRIQVNEELVIKHSFDIIFAFDEVVSFGHRETGTLSQIKTYTEMDSHEEKIHQMIEQSKVNEAKEVAKRKGIELAKQQAKLPKADSKGSSTPVASIEDQLHSLQIDMISSRDDSSPSVPPWLSSMGDDSQTQPIRGNAPKKSMVLSKTKPDSVMSDLFGGPEPEPAAAAAAAAEEPAKPVAVNPLLEPISVEIEEKITANLTTDGNLQGEVECQGSFQVTVLDAARADLPLFRLSPLDQKFKYKAHPNLNKQFQQSDVLEMKDSSKALKANSPTPLIRWRMTTTGESFLPIALSCWPSATADGTQVVLEFELKDTSQVLEEVKIRFPAPAHSRPNIQSADVGEAQYDSSRQEVHWYIQLIDSDAASGTLEFSASADQASLLPFTFEAARRETSCPVDILECAHAERKDALEFRCEKSARFELTVGV